MHVVFLRHQAAAVKQQGCEKEQGLFFFFFKGADTTQACPFPFVSSYFCIL